MTCVSLRYMFDFKLDTYAHNLRICMHISNQIHVYDKCIYMIHIFVIYVSVCYILGICMLYIFRDICICMLYTFW